MEIELKLALPGADAQDLAKRIGRLTLLARRRPTLQSLRSVYYDTPEQLLRGQQVALRVRSNQGASRPAWRQTLKIGGTDSALSQRGEWEADLPNARLSRALLAGTPWSGIDPDGTVFRALAPRFETVFERTSWLVRRRDRSEIEVALDVGRILADGRSMQILELELELKAGPPAALFEVAGLIAEGLALLPLSASKSERGHVLADGQGDLPRRARPDKPTGKQALPVIARRVLQENFDQFCANLDMLRRSSLPELAHQARVGWRRFRSSIRLFAPLLVMESAPSWLPLRPLLAALGELRDLDVARTETLPPLADAFAVTDPLRAARWKAMLEALDEQAVQRLAALRAALDDPAAGACLLATTQWLELAAVIGSDDTIADPAPDETPRRWAERKLARLQRRMNEAAQDPGDPERRHRGRILAKRLRYGVEELRKLLPKRQAGRWHEQASGVQSTLGAERDMAQALELVKSLKLDPAVADYLLGVTTGQSTWQIPLAQRNKPRRKR